MLPVVLLVIAVVAMGVASVILGDADWVTPLVAVLIIVAAVLFGVTGGFCAAVLASAGFIVSALAGDGITSEEDLFRRPLLFFSLGIFSGYYAHGALRGYDMREARARVRLQRAVSRGEVVLHYQPVADAATGEVLQFEGLARWEDPHRGTIPPADFIPLAESDPGTIWQLTVHTIETAIRDCAEWQRQGHDLGVSVNISSAAVHREELTFEIERMLAREGLAAHKLTLEVTESAVMGDPLQVARSLAQIRALDTALVAIDDFGTGYSSLARLEQLPVDTLKIDQIFMRRASEDRRRDMLGSIISLAHSLNLTACAEGVEDERTWRVLVELGCDTIQGYFLSRPIPPDGVLDWLTQRPRESAPV